MFCTRDYLQKPITDENNTDFLSKLKEKKLQLDFRLYHVSVLKTTFAQLIFEHWGGLPCSLSVTLVVCQKVVFEKSREPSGL